MRTFSLGSGRRRTLSKSACSIGFLILLGSFVFETAWAESVPLAMSDRKAAPVRSGEMVAPAGSPEISALRSRAEETVPAPFEAIRLTPRDPSAPPDDSVGTVFVWGRAYRFDSGPIPAQIENQGRTSFVAPPAFDVRVGGRPRRVVWDRPRVVSRSPRAVEFETRGRATGLTFSAKTTVEYDGMIRVDLELTPETGAILSHFAYRLSLDPAIATFTNRHVAYDYNSLNIDKWRLLESAGRNPRTPERRFPYTPSFALGDREIGLEWWSDDNLDWQGPAASLPIALREMEDRVEFEVAPIAVGSRVTRAWSHTLALFPLPLRRTPADAHSTRFTHWSASKQFSHEGFRYHWIAFPVHFEARYHGLPGSRRNAAQAELRERLERYEVGYIPYGKLTAAPSFHPRTLENADRWAANRLRFSGASTEEGRFLEEQHAWDGRQWYGYAVCMRNADYREFLLEENLSALAAENLDGLYFDAGSVSRMCENDPRVRRKGQQVWSYFETRDFYKRLYEGTKALDPDALITVHTNGQPRALTGFMDFNFIGEALNVPFRGGGSWKDVREDPSTYVPDYLGLPDGWLEAQMFPPVGGITSILPEIKFTKEKKRMRRYQRAFLAKVFSENMHFWFGNGHHEELVRVMEAFDVLGAVPVEGIHPSWRSDGPVEAAPGLRVTTLSDGTSILVALSNLGDAAVSTSLGVTWERAKPWRWRDAESSRTSGTLLSPATRVRVPPRDFRLILLE